MTATTRFDFERAVMDSDLSPNARLVALVLATSTQGTGLTIRAEYSPSLTRLEGRTGLARSTVRKALDELEQTGWIVRHRPSIEEARSRKARTRYDLVVLEPSADGSPEAPPQPSAAEAVLGRETPQARAGDALELGRETPQARAGDALSQSYLSTSSQPSTSMSSWSSSAAVTLGTRTRDDDADDDDPLATFDLDDTQRQAFIRWLNADNPDRLLRWLERRGDLAERVNRWRDEQARQPRSQWDLVPTVDELRAQRARQYAEADSITPDDLPDGWEPYR